MLRKCPDDDRSRFTKRIKLNLIKLNIIFNSWHPPWQRLCTVSVSTGSSLGVLDLQRLHKFNQMPLSIIKQSDDNENA